MAVLHTFTGRLTTSIVALLLTGNASSLAASDADSGAYSQPLTPLNTSGLQRFTDGKSEFAARWVAPFLSGGHWGRGPQSNADSCLACHVGNGRGRAPDNPDETPQSLVLRLSAPGTDSAGRPRAHPVYGTTLNRHGVLGRVVEEGDFRVAYSTRRVAVPGRPGVELRTPVVRFAALWYGAISQDTARSLRLAQPVYGLGLLEAVPESTLRTWVQQQRKTGFNGRLNMVLDEANGQRRPGRFGLKASQPDLRQQVAAAFYDEIGVTSNLFPQEQCMPLQQNCERVERVSGVEANDLQIDRITDYLRLLAAPEQRDKFGVEVVRGERVFTSASCSVCHVPEITTGNITAFEALRNRTIHPFTDLLLHDMGAGLADQRSEFEAGRQDWRTPPLWGIGLRSAVNGNANLLHDGRARTIEEAILWHGGDAEVSRQAYLGMSEDERHALIRFVESL